MLLNNNRYGWLVVVAVLLVVVGEGAMAGQKVLAELPDGSRIFGETDLESLTIASEVMGPIKVPLTNVATVIWGQSNETSRILLTNRDQLKGAVRLTELTLTTAFGPARIGMKYLAQLRVLSSKGLLTAVADGLVLYYAFDSDDGEMVKDLSGLENDGRVNGPSYMAEGMAGGAYQFDGLDNSIRVRSSESLRSTAFTASTWVKISTKLNHDDHGILGNHKAGENVNSFLLRLKQGHVNVWFAGRDAADTLDESAEELQPGSWTLVTLTFDGTEVSVYLNGQSSIKRTVSGYSGGEYDLLIGAQEWNDASPQRLWKGWIDDVRIYNRALSADEVKMLFEEFAERRPAENR